MTFIDPMHDNLTGEPTPVGGTGLPQAAPPPGSALPDYAPYGGANMTGLAPGSSGYVSSRLAGEAAAKGEAQTYVDRRAEDQMVQDRQKMAQSYDLEAADARDPALRPWNAEQEKAKYIRGPMENFGSVGMIFAMAASAFTRTPMISALNAGAAAMQATQQSDEKAYKQAFDAWKSNSDLALKRFDMERNLYEDANKLLTTDMGLWKQKSLMLAAQFDNQKMRIMLENGMDKEVLDAQAAQFKAAEEMRKAQQGFEEYNFKKDLITGTIDAWKNDPAHPERKDISDKNPTPEYVRMKAQAYADAIAASRGMPLEAERREKLQKTLDSRLEQNKAARERTVLGIEGRASEGDKNREFRGSEGDKTRAARREISTMTDDRIRDIAGDNAELRRSLESAREKAREADKAADRELKASEGDKNRQSRENMQANRLDAALERSNIAAEIRTKIAALRQDAKDVKPSMSEGGIDLAANMLIKGNPAATTNVGRGIQGAANLTAIRNCADEILTAKGLDPEQAAELINENTAGFMGDKRGAAALALRSSQIIGASTVALNTMDRVLETSRKVSRTEFSDINKILLAGEQRTGDTNVINYGIALNTLINNYARAIGAGSNALTDTARREAHELLEKSWSQGQIESAIGQLKKELHDELRGAQEARKIWAEGGSALPELGSGAVTGTPKVPPVNLLKEGTITPFGDKGDWTLRNGKPVRVDQ